MFRINNFKYICVSYTMLYHIIYDIDNVDCLVEDDKAH